MPQRARAFTQVDVFGAEPYQGNPVAVVLDATDLTEDAMAGFARWTNLSETTFVLPPTCPEADYRLRIFTPGGEIPFAGHPTLGSAHAWLGAGGAPRRGDVLVQECALGLVQLRREPDRLLFQAPPPVRTGPLEEELLARIVRGLGIDADAVVAHQWVDNGPGWAAVQLATAAEVLALEPDDAHMTDLMIGAVGAHPAGASEQFELRAFCGPIGVREDPVTGSLNASVAQWLIGTGAAPTAYRAAQGSRVGRRGLISVRQEDGETWVGGACATCVTGEVRL
jgi:PhzF family phenazine biosynthesis protein